MFLTKSQKNYHADCLSSVRTIAITLMYESNNMAKEVRRVLKSY